MLFLLCLWAHCVTCASPQDDIDVLRDRLLASYLGASCHSVCHPAMSYTATLSSHGSWPDVDYKDSNRVNWKAAEHWTRLKIMGLAWGCAECGLDHNSTYLKIFEQSANYWFDNKFRNPNWWWNDLGVPMDMDEALLPIAQNLSAKTIAGARDQWLLAAWWKGGGTWSGENVVWALMVQVNRGLVTGNHSAVTQAISETWKTCLVSSDPSAGIQPDGSFHQHGSILQSGAYGADFSLNVMKWVYLTHNLKSFAIPSASLDALLLNVLDGQQHMIYTEASKNASHWNFQPLGRGITREPGHTSVASSWGELVGEVAAGVSSRTAELTAFASRLKGHTNGFVANKHFYNTDFMTHNRPGFHVSVRMFSSRVYNAECVNEEGKMSWHKADGATTILVSGAEYDGIWPVWAWNKIPGTTTQWEVNGTSCTKVKQMGRSVFVGGVSNGNVGAATMMFKSNDFGQPGYADITAKKSWFHTDHGFVALGADIASHSSTAVGTTLNQCLLLGDVLVDGISGPLPQGSHEISTSKSKWVHHNSVGYVFMEHNVTASLDNVPQHGDWSSINSAYHGEETLPVFTLALDHGKAPGAASYAYAVLPGVSAQGMAAASAAALQDTAIVANSASAQSILDKSAGVLYAVFFAKGSVDGGAGFRVSASAPCAMLVKQTAGKVEVSVSNPSSQEIVVTLTIDRVLHGGSAELSCTPKGASSSSIVVHLPGAARGGSSITAACTEQQ